MSLHGYCKCGHDYVCHENNYGPCPCWQWSCKCQHFEATPQAPFPGPVELHLVPARGDA